MVQIIIVVLMSARGLRSHMHDVCSSGMYSTSNTAAAQASRIEGVRRDRGAASCFAGLVPCRAVTGVVGWANGRYNE